MRWWPAATAGLILALTGAAVAWSAPAAPPPLILISFDGFRWDYTESADTPHLDELAAAGVRSRGLIPCYPSKTYPNHYSIVTGLRPGRHGIVSNNMRDPEIDAVFTLSDRTQVESPAWWGGEPIWVTVERAGLVSAALFWPGSETAVDGVYPTHWSRFDSSLPFAARVEKALAWLDLPPPARPSLIALYFEEPDGTGHAHGPESPELVAEVEALDGVVGSLLAGLEERGLRDGVNLVLVSDHGMAEVSAERLIRLDDYLPADAADVFEQGIIVQVFPRPGREDEVFRSLRWAPHLAVYRNDRVPRRYHLRSHPRLAPVLGVPDLGWQAYTDAALGEEPEWLDGGAHGFDPRHPEMHGLFLASGPAFRRGLEVARFENIHVYNLLAAALGLEPAANQGDRRWVRRLMRPGGGRRAKAP